MDVVAIIFLVLFLAAIAATVFLWVLNTRLQAKALTFESARREAEARLAPVEQRASEERERSSALADQLRCESARGQAEVTALRVEIAQLKEQQRSIESLRRQDLESYEQRGADRQRAAEERERLWRAELEKVQERSEQAFQAVAGKVLAGSSDQFLKLASQSFAIAKQDSVAALEQKKASFDSIIKPIAENLARQEHKLGEIERQWGESRAGLVEQLRGVGEAQATLRLETGRLVRALRDPHVRGAYGETTLRRVAELSGMSPYCDFSTQLSTSDGDGKQLRPDMVVNLPSQRKIAIDAKANIRAYLEAIEAEGDQQAILLDKFASDMSKQATELGRKGYWKQFEGAPEFVVMFVPGEQFIDAAMQRRPTLVEDAAASNVIIAGPATLIALLRAVAVGWNEHKLAEEARDLMKLGKELHDRAAVALDHAASLGSAIGTVVDRYNKLQGSLERRLVPTIKKFEDAGAGSGRVLRELPVLEAMPREPDVVAEGEVRA